MISKIYLIEVLNLKVKDGQNMYVPKCIFLRRGAKTFFRLSEEGQQRKRLRKSPVNAAHRIVHTNQIPKRNPL